MTIGLEARVEKRIIRLAERANALSHDLSPDAVATIVYLASEQLVALDESGRIGASPGYSQFLALVSKRTPTDVAGEQGLQVASVIQGANAFAEGLSRAGFTPAMWVELASGVPIPDGVLTTVVSSMKPSRARRKVVSTHRGGAPVMGPTALPELVERSVYQPVDVNDTILTLFQAGRIPDGIAEQLLVVLGQVDVTSFDKERVSKVRRGGEELVRKCIGSSRRLFPMLRVLVGSGTDALPPRDITAVTNDGIYHLVTMGVEEEVARGQVEAQLAREVYALFAPRGYDILVS